MIKQPNFKFLVKGDHPIFKRIDRRCVTLKEAENVKDGLEAVGYEVEIEELGNSNSEKWRCMNGCNWEGLKKDASPVMYHGIDWRNCPSCGHPAIPCKGEYNEH